MTNIVPTMNIGNLDSSPPSATFGQDASFRLEQPIGAMSISPSGRDVVLASKEGLHIIDLDSPYSPPRHLPHRTPWEVADVQWSPFAVRDYWVVSTSNQKALVWNVGVSGWRDAIEFVLHAHTRAITDINFSAHHPDMLATCAVDSFVHAWDLRAPARPAFSFSDWFAGATQVKWSRQDEHVIASSHDRFLHIWDRRKGACPARTIEAHGTKIYGVDWNRFELGKIVTCSLDRTIKFWNTANPEDVPERVIETSFPVWRARHTPFGWGLCAMPQRADTNLYLYDRRAVDGVFSSGAIPPVATFSGHKGQVREFLWRSRGTIKEGIDHRDFQLVSWGTDGELRLHTVSENAFNAVGYEKGVSKPLRLNFTRRNARYRTFRDDFHESHSPIEVPGRSESNQSYYQTFGSRGRYSTNIGMSRLPVAQFRGWLHGGKRERRTGMHGKSAVRQDINPIAWMKNVKIVSWDSDSIADEITQVGERFRKLEFESVDIGQRKAIMSLQGPWGENGATVYTRVDFRFPKVYPKDAAAIVTIYKTSSIEESVHRMLSTEVRTIAETYASRQRGCIEAIVRYLLHEQTMEQIVSWLLEESTETKDPSAAEMADGLSSDSDDDNLDGNRDPSSSSANLRVPLAKGCGAIWSATGALLCFFPQKPKENTSVSSSWSAGGPLDSQSIRLFENFGRLQTNSPARRSGNGTQPTADDTASDISDLTSTFSTSSSSSSSESEAGIRDRFNPYRNTVNIGMRARSGSLDRSNKSTTLDGTKIEEESRLNFVSIHHEMRDLLPAQKSLAEEYKIFGQRSEVCEHNAKVAEAASLFDVASVWQLAALVVEHKVPLEIIKSTEPSDIDVAVIARHDIVRLQRKDSGIDLSFDSPTDTSSVGSVRWGNSPLGSRYLIAAIFSYFERNADIQMLAMLSCILSSQQDSESQWIREGKRSTALSSLPYQPSMEVADSVVPSQDGSYNKFTFAVTRPSIAMKLEDMVVPSLREPHGRRRNTASIVSRSSIAHVEDGRENTFDSVNGGAMTRTNVVSTSASPEDSRFGRRSNSGVPFAASKASLSALAQSFQPSPPSNSSIAGSSLKKFSPSATSGWAGTLFGSTQTSRASRASRAPSEANSDDAMGSGLRGSMSLVNLQDLHRESQRLRNSRGTLKPTSRMGTDKKEPATKSQKRKIKTSLHNQSQFDLDGHAEIPLLDPELRWKYRMYQSAYAEQLGAWGLFLQQAEILQFAGGQRDQQSESPRGSAATTGYSTPKVEISRCCVECGSAFAPIEKNGVPIGWHCTSISCHITSDKPSKSQVCSICQQAVRGLSVPCLQCGHMTCYECAQAWFGDDVNSSVDISDHEDSSANLTPTNENDLHPSTSYCPAGCGCLCPTLQTIEVPYPKDVKFEQQHEPSTTPLLTPQPPASTPTLRPNGAPNARSQRHKSEASGGGGGGSSITQPGPDTAFGAMMALSRSRAASAATIKTAALADTEQHGQGYGYGYGYGYGDGYSSGNSNDNNNATTLDDLVPWSSGKFTSLGRGIGGGLSRGLSNRSSDATIRKL